MWSLTLIILAVLVAAAVSRRVKGTVITMPMIYVALGLLLSDMGLHIIDQPGELEIIRILAEVTLVLVLAADASRITVRSLFRFHTLPSRLLGVGLPLTMIAGTLLAALVFDGLTLAEAAVLGILLAPTDASLGQAVISNKAVPLRIRQTLNIESGLNDGIAMPFLLLALALVGEEFGRVSDWIWLGAVQIVMGTVAGLVVGFLGAKFVNWGRRSGWMTIHFQKISAIAIALLSYTAANLVGGNGFVAAFVMGIMSGHFMEKREAGELSEHVEVEVDMLIMLTFMIVFGAVMLPDALRTLDWRVALYAVLSLTIVRMLPVAISLIRAKVSKETITFIGWFGPRGTASILYLFTVIEVEEMPGKPIIYAATLITVLLSVFAHGLSASPGAKWYGRIMEGKEEDEVAEMQAVPKLPLRGAMGGEE